MTRKRRSSTTWSRLPRRTHPAERTPIRCRLLRDSRRPPRPPGATCWTTMTATTAQTPTKAMATEETNPRSKATTVHRERATTPTNTRRKTTPRRTPARRRTRATRMNPPERSTHRPAPWTNSTRNSRASRRCWKAAKPMFRKQTRSQHRKKEQKTPWTPMRLERTERVFPNPTSVATARTRTTAKKNLLLPKKRPRGTILLLPTKTHSGRSQLPGQNTPGKPQRGRAPRT
mmetsp:Transcript_22524/g.47685  ORF Transcript_22524/g.47685 Transcript_22524/m.47685 type:complete len:231 (+) Transcript_22524:1177-1869(+)